MDVFQDFAKYYDLLYQDKDYQQEAGFVDRLLNQYSHQKPSRLLELGSGTGKHALALARKGYEIDAVDISPTMLEIAGNLLQGSEISDKVSFQLGDVRHLNLDKTYDAAISLFHVLSYQVTSDDLMAMFSTVKKHVKPGGVFIFDCWYGPAVLDQKPAVRFKTLKNETLKIERVAVPTLEVNTNTVKVHYHLYIKEKDKPYLKMEETHLMRYLFLPEMTQLCAQFGMTLLSQFEWLTERPLSEKTWGACFVVRL